MSQLATQVRQDRRDAFRVDRRLKPSEWAAKYRVLSAKESPEPGPWRNERTPFVAGIMDAIVEPGVEEITYVKPTQVAGSEGCRNVLGYWIDEDPGPCLYVMPSEKAVREQLEERLKPLFNCPAIRSHWSSDADITQDRTDFDTMQLYFAWSGSPQALASRPCRYVILDEVDKYPPFAGREADPISLARERTKNYLHRKRIIKISTPTTRTGAIWRSWEACGDRRRFHVPCPHCGKYQVLNFQQVRWPKPEADKAKLADAIEQGKLAYYECSQCKHRISDHHKPKMLMRGVWASETQTVEPDGRLVGVRQRTKRVGFHLNAIYSPWVTFSDVAAMFIRADGDVGETMNFRNSWLAEPFEQQVSKHEPSVIRAKSEQSRALGIEGQPRVVPEWAVLLIATCDVQKDHCYYQVDAWGYELRSKRIAIGVAATLDEVYRQVFAPEVPYVSAAGVPVGVQELVVDSGYRKDEVTEFARRDAARVRMSKGLATYFGPIADAKVERASGVLVWNINTMQSKDTLDRLINDPDPMRWQVYADISEEYCLQLASEHKILDPHTRQMVWTQKTAHAANHWWDCSAMSCAVAVAMGAAMPKPVIEKSPQQPAADRPDWMPDRPTNWLNR